MACRWQLHRQVRIFRRAELGLRPTLRSMSSNGGRSWCHETGPTRRFKITPIAVYGQHGLSITKLFGTSTKLRPTYFYGHFLTTGIYGMVCSQQHVGASTATARSLSEWIFGDIASNELEFS